MNPFTLGLWAAALIGVAAGHDLIPSERTAHWPVTPTAVVRGFEPHQQYGPGHRGVDLAAAPGQTVHSALPGTVSHVGQVAGRPVVVVRHGDDLRTTYLPVNATVEVGTRVAGGQPIGRLALEPHCTLTSCLHWGARRADHYIDPLTLVRHQVVLLPP